MSILPVVLTRVFAHERSLAETQNAVDALQALRLW